MLRTLSLYAAAFAVTLLITNAIAPLPPAPPPIAEGRYYEGAVNEVAVANFEAVERRGTISLFVFGGVVLLWELVKWLRSRKQDRLAGRVRRR